MPFSDAEAVKYSVSGRNIGQRLTSLRQCQRNRGVSAPKTFVVYPILCGRCGRYCDRREEGLYHTGLPR